MVTIKQLRTRRQELASFEGNLSKGEREQLATIARFLNEYDSHAWKRENSIARRTAENIVKVFEAPTLSADHQKKYNMAGKIAKELGRLLAPRVYSGVHGHPLFEDMFEGYTLYHVIPTMIERFNFIWEHQKEVEASYGDLDYHLKRIVNEDQLKVAYIRDICTCSDKDKFILVLDSRRSFLHIRVIDKDLTLKKCSEKGYNLEHDGLGNNYVITAPFGELDEFSQAKAALYRAADIEHVYGLIESMYLELKGE
jgi:hypothetical protein